MDEGTSRRVMRHIRAKPLAQAERQRTIGVHSCLDMPLAMNHLPSLSFLQSRNDRIALARQRFFEGGQAPTGVVSEAVFESWARCLRLHGSPRERATFQPVTASRTQLALMKNRHLRQAWTEEVPRLEAMLGTANCTAMLTDATGVIIGATCAGRSHEELMPVATRLGVNLSEDAVGTTAPGVVARTGKPVCIQGGEHFFDNVKEMHCAAAPIRDIRGQLAGVFDLSSERIPFAFDAAAVAGLYAGAIENRLLVAQSAEHLVVRFQVAHDLLDSTMVGLIGIGANGRIAWENGVARSLLGGRAHPVDQSERSADPSFGISWAQLAALPAAGAAPLALPNGLQVWARAEMRAPDGRRGLVAGLALPAETPEPPADIQPEAEATAEAIAEPAPEAVPSTTSTCGATRLRESDLELIRTTLQACNGNVTDAAKQLGVSRGLIYRRLKA